MFSPLLSWQSAVIRAWAQGDVIALSILKGYDPRIKK